MPKGTQYNARWRAYRDRSIGLPRAVPFAGGDRNVSRGRRTIAGHNHHGVPLVLFDEIRTAPAAGSHMLYASDLGVEYSVE